MLEVPQALALVGKLYEFAKKANDVEIHKAVMDVSEYAQQLRHENHDLRDRVKELEQQLSRRGQLHWDGLVYWIRPDTGPADGPFCPRCNDTEGKSVRMFNRRGDDWYRCVGCGHMASTIEIQRPKQSGDK